MPTSDLGSEENKKISGKSENYMKLYSSAHLPLYMTSDNTEKIWVHCFFAK